MEDLQDMKLIDLFVDRGNNTLNRRNSVFYETISIMNRLSSIDIRNIDDCQDHQLF